MSWTNLTEQLKPGRVLAPTAVGTSVVNGDAIVEPWKTGRRLLILLTATALGASDSITFTLQRRRVGTSTWDVVKQYDNSTTLAVVDADAGKLDTNGEMMLEVNLERLRTEKSEGETYDYDAIRLSAVNANNSSPPTVAGVYVIGEAYKRPVAEDDDGFLLKQRRQTGP